MARTRAVPKRRPNINFDNRKFAAAKEMAGNDVKIKFRGNVVRRMSVRRLAKHGAQKRNVRYG